MRACSGNLSWQYVNLMNCIVSVGAGSKGIGAWFGAPSTLSIFGLDLAWHWQFVCGHLWTFYEPYWACLFLVHVIEVTYVR